MGDQKIAPFTGVSFFFTMRNGRNHNAPGKHLQALNKKPILAVYPGQKRRLEESSFHERRNIMKRTSLVTVLIVSVVLVWALMAPSPAQAGDWSINLWGGSPYYHTPAPYSYNYGYGYNRGYYPNYRPYNPVVRRDVYGTEGYAPDDTYHSENVVEDRHSSYYS